jgi:hypothetical protein
MENCSVAMIFYEKTEAKTDEGRKKERRKTQKQPWRP